MKIKSIIDFEALISIIGAIGLFIWWFLMPVFLPVSEASENFQNLILDKDWVWINSIGLLSVLLITLGFPGFFIKHHDMYNKLGFTGLILACAGLILFTSIQYYETFIWPAAAQVNPELVLVKGALVSGNTLVAGGLIASGIILGSGYILFGISALQKKIFPAVPVWLLIVGAPVFGNGVAFPVRTIGLLLFCTGTIWLSYFIRKKIL